MGLQSLHALRRIFLLLIHRGDVKKPLTLRKQYNAVEAKTAAIVDGAAAAARKRRRSEGKATSTSTPAAAIEKEQDVAAKQNPMDLFQTWMYEQYQAYIALLLNLLDASNLRTKVSQSIQFGSK